MRFCACVSSLEGSILILKRSQLPSGQRHLSSCQDSNYECTSARFLLNEWSCTLINIQVSIQKVPQGVILGTFLFFPMLASSGFSCLHDTDSEWEPIRWMNAFSTEGVWVWSGQANASNAAILVGLIAAGYFQRQRRFIDIWTRCLFHGTYIIFCISVPAAPLSWLHLSETREKEAQTCADPLHPG